MHVGGHKALADIKRTIFQDEDEMNREISVRIQPVTDRVGAEIAVAHFADPSSVVDGRYTRFVIGDASSLGSKIVTNEMLSSPDDNFKDWIRVGFGHSHPWNMIDNRAFSQGDLYRGYIDSLGGPRQTIYASTPDGTMWKETSDQIRHSGVNYQATDIKNATRLKWK
jgi:hypothetical protein